MHTFRLASQTKRSRNHRLPNSRRSTSTPSETKVTNNRSQTTPTTNLNHAPRRHQHANHGCTIGKPSDKQTNKRGNFTASQRCRKSLGRAPASAVLPYPTGEYRTTGSKTCKMRHPLVTNFPSHVPVLSKTRGANTTNVAYGVEKICWRSFVKPIARRWHSAPLSRESFRKLFQGRVLPYHPG